MDLTDIARLINNDMFLDPPISENALQTVSEFTLLWMIYEGRLYQTDYKSARMQQLVSEGTITLAGLDEYWAYFQQRYVGTEAELNATFEQLAFSSQVDKRLLQAILGNPTPTDAERTIAVLLIVHRLRNNLFHGIKQVASLNLQRENLAMANRALKDVLRRVHLHFQENREREIHITLPLPNVSQPHEPQ
jgi:hypothetical protein